MIVNSSLHGVPLLLLANKQDLEVSRLIKLRGAGVAQLVELWTEKVGSGSIPRYMVWQGIFLPESAFGADSFAAFMQPPCARSLASMSVRSLKIPDAGSHAIAWTHKNTGRDG